MARVTTTGFLIGLALALIAVGASPARANAIFIDASVLGAPPVLTVDDPSLFSDVTITAQTAKDSWFIDVTVLGIWSGGGNPLGFELFDPTSGKLVDSFGFNSVQFNVQRGPSTFEFALFEKDENGDVAGRFRNCPNRNPNIPLCQKEVEDGSFQLAEINGTLVGTDSQLFNVFLKGTVDSVPEAGSLVLLGGALVGAGLLRRRAKVSASR
jgi:hypothetical protein